MTINAGTRLGRYEICSKIGEGGMGEVYLARDTTELERSVAIKVLPAEFASDKERLHRFIQEAKTASSLNHPNILTIYEIGESDSMRFIVTEFIDGDTLRHRLAQFPLALDEALDVAIQVGSALVAAHRVKIVHRDIKPENIMVRRDGIAKVLDFGLAKLTESTASPVDSEAVTRSLINTVPGRVIGTLNYMSPEQARGKEIDARADIWSLGVVVYEMLTGRFPFSGETTSDLLAAILMTEVVTPKYFNSKVPTELERIVMKALRKESDERYQTANDLLIDLRQVKKQLEFAAELERTGSTRKIGKAETKTSIAVLPFVNMSADAENEYFCDGLAEELLNALAKIDGLKVAARTSAFSFKGKNVGVRGIAQALNVNTMLEGSVRKTGNRLRITVQLVNAADGYHLWSARYDREMKDLFEVQDEIATEISEKLRLRLTSAKKILLTKRHTENTQAYLLYLKGRFHQNKRTAEGLKKGIEYFEKATEADANYALAYAGLADSYLLLGIFGERSARLSMPKAQAAAARAMEIDSTLGEACASLAYVKAFYEWDWTGSEEQFAQAIKLNPDYPTASHFYSFYLAGMGRLDEAIAIERRAQRLDPISLIISTNIGRYLYYERRYDQAITQSHATLEMDPSFFPARVTLGLSYEQMGLHEEAIAEFQNALDNSGGDMAMESLGHAYALAGKRAESLALVEKLIEQSSRRYASPYCVAIIYLGLGEKDEAFTWLDKAYEDRAPWLVFIKVDPRFDNLRSDGRYAELLTLLGL